MSTKKLIKALGLIIVVALLAAAISWRNWCIVCSIASVDEGLPDTSETLAACARWSMARRSFYTVFCKRAACTGLSR